MELLRPPGIAEIRAARIALAGRIVRTPLVPLNEGDGTAEIYLKLENLQPTGSFKVRSAGSALASRDARSLQETGVWTASAGNMGQALAWFARQLQIPCRVLVPDDAPLVKIQAIQALGAAIVSVPFAVYQGIQKQGGWDGMDGTLVHPFADQPVLAGSGTLGMEILEEFPAVERILVPFGGGGLSCGIAAAVKALAPRVRVEAVELETATPLTASLSAGMPVETSYRSSFVSGMGAPFVFPQMWQLASRLLDGTRVVSLEQVAAAIRLLAERHHVIAEGAGAVSLAAALADPAAGRVVCVISGGNINPTTLTQILQGETP